MDDQQVHRNRFESNLISDENERLKKNVNWFIDVDYKFCFYQKHGSDFRDYTTFIALLYFVFLILDSKPQLLNAFVFTNNINIVCYAVSILLIMLLVNYSYHTNHKTAVLCFASICINLFVFHNEYDFITLIFPAIYLYSVIIKEKKEITFSISLRIFNIHGEC